MSYRRVVKLNDLSCRSVERPVRCWCRRSARTARRSSVRRSLRSWRCFERDFARCLRAVVTWLRSRSSAVTIGIWNSPHRAETARSPGATGNRAPSGPAAHGAPPPVRAIVEQAKAARSSRCLAKLAQILRLSSAPRCCEILPFQQHLGPFSKTSRTSASLFSTMQRVTPPRSARSQISLEANVARRCHAGRGASPQLSSDDAAPKGYEIASDNSDWPHDTA